MINAALFGALAGSGTLPLPRAACEAAIRSTGKGAEASLRGFALGYASAEGKAATVKHPGQTWGRTRRASKQSCRACAPGFPRRSPRDDRSRPCARRRFPGRSLRRSVSGPAGADSQSRTGHSGAQDSSKLTGETARFLALWMSYEDVIRVADLKSRRSRFERVRAEVQAKPDEPVHIIEYLRPGVEEAAALLPSGLSRRLLAWTGRRGLMHKLNLGLHVNSSSVTGFPDAARARLAAAAAAHERALRRGAGADRALARCHRRRTRAELALEIALCGRLIKGYGDTNRRAKASFLRIFDTLIDGGAVADRERTARAGRARSARGRLPTRRAAASRPLSRARHRAAAAAAQNHPVHAPGAGANGSPGKLSRKKFMETQFNAEIESLKLGAGETFHGEGILAVTKALLQSGVSYVGGYQGAPVSHLLDVMVQARDYMAELGVHVEACTNEASAAAMLGASINYPARGAVTWKSIVGTNVASDALTQPGFAGVLGGALIVVGEDYGEGASVIQERTHALALKSSMWMLDPRPATSPPSSGWWSRASSCRKASNTPVFMDCASAPAMCTAASSPAPTARLQCRATLLAEPAAFDYEHIPHPPATYRQES